MGPQHFQHVCSQILHETQEETLFLIGSISGVLILTSPNIYVFVNRFPLGL